MKPYVIGAIFRRNFVSYFSTPTGYLFICVFACCCAMAAFWPNDFFANNLANLDQLNGSLPWILLVFVPTITMSVWADERRQGTDELLLTLPAGDLDVVLGKYLAALGIYSAALLFTLMSVLLVMELWLGSPDLTLFLGNFFGYWLVGAAMLSIGMVASFLTASLTVGFILGVLFNLPLVLLRYADTVVGGSAFRWSRWSISEQFRDFGQGVISLSSVLYFVMIVVVMLYLSMVLIGRRHWVAGRDGHSMLGHYCVRAIALAVVALGLNALLQHADARFDVSAGGISQISPATRDLIRNLDPKHPINIDAYISPEVPEQLAQRRIDMINELHEIERAGGNNVNVTVHETKPLSDEADRADKQYGIKPRKFQTQVRGAFKVEDVFMGVAFNSGLEKVVVPFVDPSLSIEYEMARSIATVSKQERKRVGVLLTDVELFGGFNMQTFQPRPQSAIITELEKQYTVERVDATKPITDHYDVLLAIQPSSLSQPQMDNFIAAVKAGQHTLILDDPAPIMWGEGVSGMTMPRAAPRDPRMQQGPPPPKGDITPLWQFLGVDWAGKEDRTRLGNSKFDAAIVWQNYNPYPQIDEAEQHTNEWVFVDAGMPKNKEPFNQSEAITSHLQEMLFFYPGGLEPRNAATLRFTPLVTTGPETGIVLSSEAAPVLPLQADSFAAISGMEARTGKQYVMAARIQGAVEANHPDPLAKDADSHDAKEKDKTKDKDAKEKDKTKDKDAKEKDKTKDKDAKEANDKQKNEKDKNGNDKSDKSKTDKPQNAQKRDVDVVLVTDIDMVSEAFFQIRAGGDTTIQWNMDNITFFLNALDELAGDNRFIEIRKRKAEHPRLVRIQDATADAEKQIDEEKKSANEAGKNSLKQAQDELDKDKKALKERLEKSQQAGTLSFNELQAAAQESSVKETQLARKFDREMKEKKKELDDKLHGFDRQKEAEVDRARRKAKLWALVLPPILPLLLGFVVFFGRRAREQEGVSKARLR